MKNPSFLPLLLFTTVLFHLHLRPTIATLDPTTIDTTTYATSPGPSPATTTTTTTTADTEFIHANCLATLYPELCYNSLVGYASSIRQDSSRLARVAVGVSLSRAKRMANYVSNLSRQADYGAEPRTAAALHDCYSVFGDAVDQMRGSLKQMRQLTGSGRSLRFQMSNVQTWMSAALTYEDTCTDGLSDAPDGPVKYDVVDRVSKVMQVTSNALALVNSYVAKVTTP